MQMTYLDSVSGNSRVSAEGASVLFDTPAQSKARAQAVMAMNERRLDSVFAGKGFHLARELEFAYQAVIEQKYAELKGLTLIPKDTEVPAGATTYKITSEDSVGSARYHRGEGMTVPRVGVTRDEEHRPVRHIINGFELNVFELKSSDFASTNIRAKFQRTAQRAMMEFLNEKVWLGSDQDDVYGILNYPYCPKMASTVEISEASTSTNEEILAELNRIARTQYVNTEEVFSPDTMCMPTRQYEFISQTQMNFAGTVQTIKEAFLRDNGHITSVESVPFLRGKGPNGEDVILCIKKNDSNAAANVVPEDFSMLPAEANGFSIFVPCYMSHGGVRMWYPLNNLIVYSPAV